VIDTLVIRPGANETGGINFCVSGFKLLDDARGKAVADERRQCRDLEKVPVASRAALSSPRKARRSTLVPDPDGRKEAAARVPIAPGRKRVSTRWPDWAIKPAQ